MIYLVDLPDPVHGMALMNMEFVDKMCVDEQAAVIINTAPSYAANLYFRNISCWTVLKFFHSIFCNFLLLFNLFNVKNRTVYRSLNGGWGQVYDLIYVTIAKLFRCNIFLHHHSFNYLDKKSTLFHLIHKVSGKNTVHIVLAEPMKTLLCDKYGISANNVIVLSNLALLNFGESSLREVDNKVVKLGFLSNCCFEKGVDVFLAVCSLLTQHNITFLAEIAGPVSNSKTLQLINSAIKQNNNITYVGSLYENDKHNFYKNIDCFLFPTNYEHEAEPVVLYEAASYGALLIATPKGAIEHVLANLGGATIGINNAAIEACNVITKSINNEMFNYAKRVERKKLLDQQKAVEEATIAELTRKIKMKG